MLWPQGVSRKGVGVGTLGWVVLVVSVGAGGGAAPGPLVIDVSTPQKAAEVYYRGVIERRGALLLGSVDLEDPVVRDIMEGLAAQADAVRHFIDAVNGKFGKRAADGLIDGRSTALLQLLHDGIVAAEVEVAGDRAVVRPKLPHAVGEPDMGLAFEMRLRRGKEGWRVVLQESADTYKVQVEPRRRSAAALDLARARVMEVVAGEVEAGKFAGVAEVGAALQGRQEAAEKVVMERWLREKKARAATQAAGGAGAATRGE